MADQLPHPVDRAVHAVNNAAQIAGGAAQLGVRLDSADAARIVALLADVPADIKALQDLSLAQTDEILELRKQGMRDTNCINTLERLNTKLTEDVLAYRRKLSQANAEVEQLLQCASIRLQAETADFNRIRSLRDTLHESTIVADGYLIIEPRAVAAGGQ